MRRWPSVHARRCFETDIFPLCLSHSHESVSSTRHSYSNSRPVSRDTWLRVRQAEEKVRSMTGEFIFRRWCRISLPISPKNVSDSKRVDGGSGIVAVIRHKQSQVIMPRKIQDRWIIFNKHIATKTMLVQGLKRGRRKQNVLTLKSLLNLH